MPSWKNGVELGVGGGDLGTLDDVTNTIYVDANAPSGGDGSQANPLDTINAAIALIQANGDAAANNRYTVRIAAGTYDENVRARVSYTTFLGAGRDITTIAASSGMGFYGGNATEASLDAFEAAGSHAKALVDTDYVDLIKDGALPEITGNRIQDITIAKYANNFTDLMIMNVDDGDSTTALGWDLQGVYVDGDSYFRNMVVLNTHNCVLRFELRMRNVRAWSQRGGEVGNLTTLYDGAQPKPGAGLGTLAYLALNDVYSYDNVHLDNCYYRLEELEVNNTLTIKDCVGSTAVMRDVEATNIVLEGSTHASTSINGLKALTGLQINNPVAINATIINPDIGTGGITAASGGTNNVQIKGGTVLGPITDPDGYITYTAPTDQRVVDIDFTAQATEDLKAGGDGNYTYGGHEFAATNVAGAQSADLINGTGLVIQADESQELRPESNLTTAPQLRRALTALIETLDVSESDGLRLYMRMTGVDFSTVRETVGFGLISSGSNPARFVGALKTSSGIDLYHHAPATVGARGQVSADNTPDVLILEKAPGLDVWSIRAGSWSSGWPDIDDTTLLGAVALSSVGTTLLVGASAGMTRYSDLEFVMFVSNVAGTATDYLHAQSAGDRSGTIAVTATLTTSGALSLFVNGDTTSDTVLRWNNTEAVAGKYVQFDFGSAVFCNEAKFYVAASPTLGHGVWKWQGSNDAAAWTDISADFTLQGSSTGAVVGDMSANTTSYRYLRILGVSGSSSNSQWLREFEFQLSVGYSTGNPTDYDAVGTFKNLRAEKF